MMAAIGTSQTATAPRGGLVQCVMAVCLDNAVNPNESFIQAQTTSIVSGRDGSTLIPAGSIVRGSVRFDAGTRRAFAEGQWTITVGDQEWVFAGTAVEPSEPLPAADGSGGRGLRTDVLPAKADDNAVTQKAREVIIASQSQTPPGLPGNMPPANWQKEEIARLRSIVQSGDYLFLGRGKPFLLYLSRLIDVRTLQGSVISPIPPREQPAQTSPINDVPTGPYSDLPQH